MINAVCDTLAEGLETGNDFALFKVILLRSQAVTTKFPERAT